MSELIPFDDSALTNEVKGKLKYCADAIKKLGESHVKSGVGLGEHLAAARAVLDSETTFRQWVESVCGYSIRTAYNYISAWEHFGPCANVCTLELSAMYELAKNEIAKNKALKLADKGIRITHKMALELIASCKPKPPRLPAPKVEDAEFTVVSSEENERTPVDEDTPEAASEEETGKDGRTEAQGKKPQETAPRPTRTVKEKPGDVPCPNCSKRKWTEDDDGWACASCHHPHGEPVGDRDDDDVVDERITTKKAKTRKTIEAAMREFDDLQVLVPKPREHAEVISMCKIMLNKLKNWN